MHITVAKKMLGMLLMIGMLLSTPAWAAKTPHQVVESKTQEMLAIAKTAKSSFKSNPGAFYQKVDRVLTPVIDFREFSRNVMGMSHSSYSKLSAADKKKFNAQLDKFSRQFKKGLITRYGSLLVAVDGDAKITVGAPSATDRKNIAARNTTTVEQYLVTQKGKKYTAVYAMKPDSRGNWKVRNITIEGVNVGKLYRKQFADNMKKYGNNVDKVIANWSVEPKR